MTVIHFSAMLNCLEIRQALGEQPKVDICLELQGGNIFLRRALSFSRDLMQSTDVLKATQLQPQSLAGFFSAFGRMRAFVRSVNHLLSRLDVPRPQLIGDLLFKLSLFGLAFQFVLQEGVLGLLILLAGHLGHLFAHHGTSAAAYSRATFDCA